MVWSKISPATGKPLYIKRYNNFYFLSKDSKGAIDSIPDGYEVITLPSGHLRLRRKS